MRSVLVVMSVSLPVLAALTALTTVTACIQLSTGATDGGVTYASSGGATASAASSGAGGGATSGTGCVTDPQSGITLCEQISNCPGVDVDPGAFPGCGFRMNAASLYDLECGCGDSLCPIGVPSSCATALQLLDQQESSLVVCQEVDQGTCLPLAVDAGTAATGSSSCDKQCASECAGEPSCLQLCGC
jgi:hypothetical protein